MSEQKNELSKTIDESYRSCLQCLLKNEFQPNSLEWKFVWDTLEHLRLFYERKESHKD